MPSEKFISHRLRSNQVFWNACLIFQWGPFGWSPSQKMYSLKFTAHNFHSCTLLTRLHSIDVQRGDKWFYKDSYLYSFSWWSVSQVKPRWNNMLTNEQWFYWDLMWPWPLDQKNFNTEGHWKAFTRVKYMYEQNMTKGERKYDKKTTLYMP